MASMGYRGFGIVTAFIVSVSLFTYSTVEYGLSWLNYAIRPVVDFVMPVLRLFAETIAGGFALNFRSFWMAAHRLQNAAVVAFARRHKPYEAPLGVSRILGPIAVV